MIRIPEFDQSTLPINPAYLKSLLTMIVTAGKTALDMRAGVDISTKSGPEDLVTCADKKLSEILLAELGNHFPEDHIVSEEDPFEASVDGSRRWFIDPIDGTKFYVKETGQWSVMLGLIDGNQPLFGLVYMPSVNTLYFGGPACGSFRLSEDGQTTKVEVGELNTESTVRTLISKNDFNQNLWAGTIPGIEVLTASSIGVDVHEVLSGRADAFVHIRPTLKAWDTAAAAAIALGAGLEIGTEYGYGFEYPHNDYNHDCHIIIGRKGMVKWWQQNFQMHAQTVLAPAVAPAQPVLAAAGR